MKTVSNVRVLVAASLLWGSTCVSAERVDVSAMASNGVAPEVSAKESELPFREIPNLIGAFIDPAPADRGDGLVVGTLAAKDGKRDMIVELAQAISGGAHGRFDSLLIAHRGSLQFESYYLRGRVDLPHPQASATKAYLSMAVGRAIQMGYLTMADLDRPLVGFLTELDPTKFVEGAESITLHSAMTMSSGLRLSREKRDELNESDPSQLKGQGQIQTYLEHSPAISEEDRTFDYKFTDPSMVMQVLDSAVPGTAKDFIRREVLEKLGITVYGWLDGHSGLPEGNHSSSMTSRDMMKWGLLVMNDGRWNGEQLISTAFIERATNRILHPRAEDIFFVNASVSDPGYGYFWWQADLKVGNKSYLSRSAQGGGGQYIIVIDELDLIVVTTGHDRDLRPLRVTAEKIIPAFVKE